MTAFKEGKGSNDPPPAAENNDDEETGFEPTHGGTEADIFRLEDLCCLPDGSIAIADHANGVMIFSSAGEHLHHLHGDKDTLAFGIRYDAKRKQLVTLILDRPGWIVNLYELSTASGKYELVNQIPLPMEPEVPRMKLRWLAVTYDGDIFVTAGPLIWKLRDRQRNEWSLMYHDKRVGAWFSHLLKVPSKTDKFLVCFKGDQVLEATINDRGLLAESLENQIVAPELVEELGTYTMDAEGNLLVSHWTSGDIVLLDPAYNLLGKVGNAGPGEPSYMATHNDTVFVGCKQTKMVKAYKYRDSAANNSQGVRR